MYVERKIDNISFQFLKNKKQNIYFQEDEKQKTSREKSICTVDGGVVEEGRTINTALDELETWKDEKSIVRIKKLRRFLTTA
jgi:pyrimidine operon attenuation protein/uracil phosphoribosyltransferase